MSNPMSERWQRHVKKAQEQREILYEIAFGHDDEEVRKVARIGLSLAHEVIEKLGSFRNEVELAQRDRDRAVAKVLVLIEDSVDEYLIDGEQYIKKHDLEAAVAACQSPS